MEPGALAAPPAPTVRKLNTEKVPIATLAAGTTITDDGRYAVTVGGSGCRTVAVRELKTGKVVAGKGTAGAYPESSNCQAPTVTGDGRFLVENSRSARVATDTNKANDVYLRDVRTGEYVRASVGGDGTQGNRSAYFASVSDDGRMVAFTSRSSLDPAHPVPASEESDDSAATYAYVKNTTTGAVTLLAGPNGDATQDGGPVLLSGDGSVAIFRSVTRGVSGERDRPSRMLVRDLRTGATADLLERIGLQPFDVASVSLADASLSDDGRRIAFVVESPGALPTREDFAGVYVSDLTAGKVVHRVGTAAGAPDATALRPFLSGDGKALLFASRLALEGNRDRESFYPKLYVTTLSSGATRRVARGTGESGEVALAVSDDATVVAFSSANDPNTGKELGYDSTGSRGYVVSYR